MDVKNVANECLPLSCGKVNSTFEVVRSCAIHARGDTMYVVMKQFVTLVLVR
jgi:hypothetical protein